MFECFPQYTHVASRAAGVVPFLYNHYHVPHVIVHEVNMEVGTRHHPPLTALHWVHYRPSSSIE